MTPTAREWKSSRAKKPERISELGERDAVRTRLVPRFFQISIVLSFRPTSRNLCEWWSENWSFGREKMKNYEVFDSESMESRRREYGLDDETIRLRRAELLRNHGLA